MSVDKTAEETAARTYTSWADCYEVPGPDLFDKVRAFAAYGKTVIEDDHYFYRWPLSSANTTRVKISHPFRGGETREMIMLGSNSYLGLTNDPRVVEASVAAARKYGYGAGSVPLYSGTTELHVKLEKRLAAWYRCEDAVLFPSGYSANVGAISALVRKPDSIVNDLFNHASIYDGCRLSGATLHTFGHRNVRHLDRLLPKVMGPDHGTLVVTDGVFSMEGDLAPLDELVTVCRKHGVRLMLDDSHALGVMGPHGRGTAEHFGVEGQIDLTVGTLSKALGGIGGCLAGSHEVIEYVRFYARSFFFSGSIPTPSVAGALAILDIIEKDSERREDLWRCIRYMREGLISMGFDIGNTESAIIPIMVGNESKLKPFLHDMLDAGIFMNFVAFPAVPRQRCRLRMSMMAGHSKADLDYVLETLGRLGRKYEIIS